MQSLGNCLSHKGYINGLRGLLLIKIAARR